MTILITGLNGSFAPRLAEAARAAGHDVVGWGRQAERPAASACATEPLAAGPTIGR